jgi:LuxR family maltose regulon positive regulatory protein
MLNSSVRLAGLSQREKEIFEALLKGLPYKEIADQHFISVNTVKTHAKKIYSKLSMKNRIELLTAFTPANQPIG